MHIIGIVGGVASGKSLVTDCLARQGVAVLDADREGHEVLREPEVVAALTARWGSGILNPDGHVNRSAVAKLVFAPGGDADRAFLDGISHPRIAARLRQQIEEVQATGRAKIVVLDAALLLETGWSRLCDAIWFVAAPAEIRRQRALARGWSPEQWQAREAAQWPVEDKLRHATAVIDNSRQPEETCEQVRELIALLKPDGSPAPPMHDR